jgi:alkaline phosphatase/alkaline phosphatase D
MKSSAYQLLLLPLLLLFSCTPETKKVPQIDARIVLLSGEITSTEVILQGRFGASDTLIDYDVPGVSGSGYFQIAEDPEFSKVQQTKWLIGTPENDYIIKSKVKGLKPGSKYYFRIKSLIENSLDTIYSSIGSFRLFPGANETSDISFAISTGFNYEKFYGTDPGTSAGSKGAPASGIDRTMGFEAFEAVSMLEPDIFIANGDVVYYDKPGKQKELWARDLRSMRAKWHRYLAMPRNRALCLITPVYYMKDDHDYRFNDCDTTDMKFSEPSHELGIQVFREQLPVVDPEDKRAKTYRTVRAGNLLQLWFLEGRDYRSPNLMEDTNEKSIWGIYQKEWLKRTLLESEATFKIIISPTPMIGPDDAYKKDNHTNTGGFQSEQQEFFSWLLENGFLNEDLYFVCGDRHWQYHSIHPNGLEEFSSGAFVNQNSRPGRKPGDPESTDPEAKIKTPFLQIDEWGGGFLYVKAFMDENNPTINFSFRDTAGGERYSVEKQSLGR